MLDLIAAKLRLQCLYEYEHDEREYAPVCLRSGRDWHAHDVRDATRVRFAKCLGGLEQQLLER